MRNRDISNGRNSVLRDYQIDCINSVLRELKSSRRCLVTLSTGAGKTVIFTELTKRAELQSRKTLIVVQKNILIEQTNKYFKNASIYNASYGTKDQGNITIASIQSIINAKDLNDYDMLIIDEVHRYSINTKTSQIRKLIKKINNEKLIILGFTATPFQGNAGIFGKDCFFDKIVFKKELRELTPKYLVPVEYQAQAGSTKIDLSKVKKNKGDFVESDLQRKIMENLSLIHDQINDMLKKSHDRKKVIILCAGIDHAEYVYKCLKDASILHSKRKDKKEQFDKFTKTDCKFLVSVVVASEGFDYPPADCLCMFRPTRSYVMYIQSVGRILRKYKEKEDGLFLDYGGIVENLGCVYDAYKNIGKKKVKNDLKMCVNCEAYNNKSNKVCSKCSHDFYKMCQFCYEMTPMKPIECVHCNNKKKNNVNMFKNLTREAGLSNNWRKVHKVTVEDYQSKAGNACKKITYHLDFIVVVEYCIKGREKAYSGGMDFDFFTKSVKYVTIAKEGQYKKIKQRKF